MSTLTNNGNQLCYLQVDRQSAAATTHAIKEYFGSMCNLVVMSIDDFYSITKQPSKNQKGNFLKGYGLGTLGVLGVRTACYIIVNRSDIQSFAKDKYAKFIEAKNNKKKANDAKKRLKSNVDLTDPDNIDCPDSDLD
ncbi:hypothetical protein [Coprococcus sp. HCN-4056]|jgi:hypothetical protein|uniref:hypothetical protein n=1 Tax=Coprococcus sp. HCN-4056 TaxID=3134671 RepID=UPI0030C480AD